MSKRYLGILFKRNIYSGIAKVNITGSDGSVLYADHLIDLYHPDFTSSTTFEDFTMWVTLPKTDVTYTWQVEHSGMHSPYASSPYSINYDTFILQSDSIAGHTTNNVVLIDSTNKIEYSFTVANDIHTNLYVRTTYTGDGATNLFKVGTSSLRSYKFVRFSTDNGNTWKYPYDLSISWGSNAGYDDEIINANGEFWVEFLDAPAAASTILIDVIPVFDAARVELTLHQPGDGVDFVEYNTPYCVQEYAAEFKV